MPDVEVAWLTALADASGVALVGVDLLRRTACWSRGAEAMFGWRADEVRGRPPPIVPPALLEEWQLQMQRALESGEPAAAAETQRVARDGRSITVLRSTSIARDAAGNVIGVLDLLIDVTALEQMDEESRALTQVRERELVAMDLHDGLIQSLYALVLSLASHERDLEPNQAQAVHPVRAAREDVQRVIEEMRAYVATLRARDFVPRHLEPGLRLLADGMRLNAAVDVQLTLDRGVEPLLPPEVRGHVLYLTREAVSNVLRHAGASCVRIGLTRSDETIVLKIVDNGRGFATEGQGLDAHHLHQGLRNMAERARLVGGRLDVESRPGRGTRVRLRLKLPRQSSGVAPAL